MKDLKLSLIVAAIDRATAPIRRIGSGLKGLEERAGKLHKAFHKLGMAEMVGGAFFTGAVVEAGHAAIETADKFGELGESMKNAGIASGAGLGDIQRWSFAARQLGVDAAGVPRAFSMMGQHMSQGLTGNKESLRALRALKIDLKELKALSGDPSAAIHRIMQGFEGIKNASTRARVGKDMFGRGWLEMAPLLAAPREDIERFFADFTKSGAEMSEADVKLAEAYMQSKGRMGAATLGLGKKISLGLMPALTSSFDKITNWIEALRPADVDRFTGSVGHLADDMVQLLPKAQGLIDGAAALADRFLKLTSSTGALHTILAALGVIIAAQIILGLVQLAAGLASATLAVGSFIGFLASLVAIAPAATGAMELLDFAFTANPIGVVVMAIGLLIAALAGVAFAVTWVINNWSGLATWWGGLWEKVKGPVELMFPLIRLFAEGFHLIKTNWGGITSFFSDLFRKLGSIFSDGWDRITKSTPDWLKTVLKIGGIGALTAFSPVSGAAAAGAAFMPPPPTPGAPRAVPPGHGPADSHHKIELHLKVSNDGSVRVGAMAASADASLHVERGPLIA